MRVAFAALALFVASSTFGQAIVLDRGQSTFATSYSHGFVKYHIGSDGVKSDQGHITSYALRPQVSYGLTDRVTMDADISPLGAKYDGVRPHGRLDDGAYHATLQDLRLGLRANLLIRPLFVTPFMRFIIPSHNYSREGHTATGKGKGEFTAGFFAGRDFGPSLPNGFFEAMASQTFVQRTSVPGVASQRRNRTNGSLEIGYFLTQALTVSAFGNGARTHGGWDFPRKFGTGEFVEHDQFDKTKYIQFYESDCQG